jgi:AraC-like DNA-binding protein
MLFFESFTPCAQLQPYVKRYFFVSSELEDGYAQRMLPSDVQCICFGLNNNATQRLVNATGLHDPMTDYIVGQLSMPCQSLNYGNPVVLAAQFRSYGMYSLYGIPMHEFTDYAVSLDQISNAEEKALIAIIHEQRELPDQIRALESYLLYKVEKSRYTHDLGKISRAHHHITSRDGSLSIVQLASELNMSERSLERSFREMIGLSPKAFSGVVRIKKAMQLAESRKKPEWNQIVYSLGYTDQAHFVKDFKKYIHQTPSEYYHLIGDFERFFSK